MSAKKATLLASAKPEDALNRQKVSQEKQLSVEARHISSILKNSISQVEIAAALSSVLQINNMHHVMDENLSKALQDLQLLDERQKILPGAKQESEDEEERTQMKRARLQLEKDIKNSVKNILRLLQAHPDATDLSSVLDMKLGESECKLIRALEAFHSHMVEKLLISPDEELQLSLSKQVSPSPAHNLQRVVSQEDTVGTAMKHIDSLISETQLEIKKLECSLQENKTHDASGSPLTDKQGSPHANVSKKQASLQQEICQHKVQLSNLILENRQSERVLQEKNKNIENEIEYLLQHFDDKMERKQADLELNELERQRNEEELQKLEVPFSVLKMEYEQIQEKRRLAEEKRKEDLRMLVLKTKAAIYAQAWWRGHSVRKALLNKAKSKKPKKGKVKKK